MIQQPKKTLTLKMKAGTVMLHTTCHACAVTLCHIQKIGVSTRYVVDWFDLEVKKNAAVLTLDAVTIHETK
jgi:hypothetical protein